MLHLNDITYRIEGRLLLDKATAAIPSGHKVGLVGRNGTGKTTLLRLITGEIAADDGAIQTGRNMRIGTVAQEAPGGSDSLIDTVLTADAERTALMAEAETATDPDRIAEIQLRLTDIDAYSAPARAATILAGLGFDEAAQQQPCAEFSGGWRMRVALAAALFDAPDILLLDEPTNYLDLEGALWLEQFLAKYPHTIVIVSHDRDLLNTSVNAILHLDQHKLTLYTGGYDAFEATRRERQRLDLKMQKKQEDARKHMQGFVDRFRAQANKARQAQSRIKALERMKPIAAQIENQVTPFSFPDPEKILASPLVRMEDVDVGYEEGNPVLRDISTRLDHDDRIGLLGTNGNGKSTFAKLVSGRLDPMEGKRYASKKMIVGYFAQHQMDELDERKSPYDLIAELMPENTEAQKRAKLGALGFGADKADTKCEKLSGGEKARMLFALATFHKPHLLILDEPTNHLDVDSRESLIHAVNAYSGAVILISHDRHLLEACAERLWIVRDGAVTSFDDDLEAYRRICLAERGGRKPGKGKKSVADDAGGDAPAQDTRSKAERRRAAAEAREQLSKLRKDVRRYEREMETLASELETLDAKLGDESLYEDAPEKAADLAKERARIVASQKASEEAWLKASELLEAAAV
ncbi:MAG: ABC-F family ATP-binding cassette domain-containing protein [Pseudomonadota bacterium]